jgi:hypothetical protein
MLISKRKKTAPASPPCGFLWLLAGRCYLMSTEPVLAVALPKKPVAVLTTFLLVEELLMVEFFTVESLMLTEPVLAVALPKKPVAVFTTFLLVEDTSMVLFLMVEPSAKATAEANDNTANTNVFMGFSS